MRIVVRSSDTLNNERVNPKAEQRTEAMFFKVMWKFNLGGDYLCKILAVCLLTECHIQKRTTCKQWQSHFE